MPWCALNLVPRLFACIFSHELVCVFRHAKVAKDAYDARARARSLSLSLTSLVALGMCVCAYVCVCVCMREIESIDV